MKKRIYTYIILPLLSITVQSMDIFGQHQSKHWHKSLVQLHNKSNQKNEKNSIQEIQNASPEKKKNENEIDYYCFLGELANELQQAQEVDKGSTDITIESHHTVNERGLSFPGSEFTFIRKSSVSSSESTKVFLGDNLFNINLDLEDTKNETPLETSDEEFREQDVTNYKLKEIIEKLKRKLANYRAMKNRLRDFKSQQKVEKKNLKKEIKDLKDQLEDKKKPSTNLNEGEKNSTYLLSIIYLSTGAIISLLAIKTVNPHSTTKTVEK